MEDWVTNIRKLKTELGLYNKGETPCVYEEDRPLYHDNYGHPVEIKFNGCEKCKDKECQFRGAEYKGI